MTAHDSVDAVVVGAGFAGLYMLYRLRGLGLSVRVFEAGSGIGGTWFWNRYPGARCDAQSMEYSYQFSEALQQEWHWTERYASQPEILRYINHVADRFDLRSYIELNSRVASAVYQDQGWAIRAESGTELRARFLIMATGCLSVPNLPDIAGLDSFGGEWHHTGRWPHEGVEFTGKRVAVIGTGSSGIQAIPLIAERAAQLYVFQRTPNYSVPAQNGPLSPEIERAIKADYVGYRRENSEKVFGTSFPENPTSALELGSAERERIYQERWEVGGLGFLGAFGDLMLDMEANNTAAEFLRGKIRATVTDPEVADLLCPNTVLGCKRLCVDTDYYETYNRANVTLIDVNQSPIEAIMATGLRTSAREFLIDTIVFATGFDAMTGALFQVDIRGSGGVTLKQKWSQGPLTYLGLTSAGFPNFFIITGPGSPSVLSNMLPSIEQHVNWISDCIAHMEEKGLQIIEATEQAEREWVAHVNDVADRTLFCNCNSWYLGANVPGKPRVFMPYVGVPPYAQKCREVAASGYAGFELRAGRSG